MSFSEFSVFLKEENALRTHIQQEVEDAEVGKEAVLLGIDLIIGTGGEVRVWEGVLGVDDVAEVFKVTDPTPNPSP